MSGQPPTDVPAGDGLHGAPPHPAPAGTSLPAVPAETSYEVALDEEPEPGPPVYADITSPAGEVHPVIPVHLRTLAGIRSAAGRRVRLWAHKAAFQALRSPRYVAVATGYAAVGAVRLVVAYWRWWQVADRPQAADAGAWVHVHQVAAASRKARGWVTVGAGLGVAAAAGAARVAPWWVWPAAAAVAVPVLARAGKPAGTRIVQPAVVTPRFRLINADIVLRAYHAAGLGHPDKPGQQIMFGAGMARDGDGSRVVIDLPHGRTFADAVKARAGIASGLDVKIQQVYLTEDPTSERRHVLWVADRDPLAVPAGRTPLLDCKPRNIWQAAPLGLDERGRKVTLLLLWISILVGAQPRKGKTFFARLLALYAALDPYVKLTVADGKDSPDWKKFRLVAHAFITGTQPTRDGHPVEMLRDALHEIASHIQNVNKFLSGLPVTECPEGKLTEQLSRKYPQLRVWMLVMEEFQVYFELDDQEVNKEIAKLLSFIMAVGPSAGVIIVSSSQKPSGVGAGDVQRLFNRYRDNHAVRFALRCGNRIVSDAILGGDAYSEGFDASSLPNGKRYRGIGYLYGAEDETPTVRSHLADGADAEKILLAARAHREAAGTLTGMAAGEAVAREVRDVLADVLAALDGDSFASWKVLCARLRARLPEAYADLTQEALSAQVRALGVPSLDGRDGGTGPVLKGARVAAVQQAAQRRQLVAGGSRG